MTIAIDCRMINASGVGVYLRGCLPWLIQSKNDFLLLGDAAQLDYFASNKNVKIIACAIKPFSVQELFFFPRKITTQINRADIYFSPFFNIPCGIKIAVYTTIHDIIFPDMPELTSRAGLAARMFFFRKAFKKSQKIFTVSEFSKSRLEYHLGKDTPVIVTYCAIQQMFLEYRANLSDIRKKDTIIFIGNIKKNKGLDYLLDAFHLARNEGLPHQLIIIGTQENFRTTDDAILKKIKSIGNDAVLFTGFVSDEMLMEHLSTASLLVQPSLYEGFCFPPLEAMVLGTHALISDIPVFREIYADFPVTFFRSGDRDDLKNKLLEMLQCKNPEPLVLTKELLLRYTFEKTAKVILRELEV